MPCCYSTTSSARESRVGGMVKLMDFAVLRVITSSKRVGCSMGGDLRLQSSLALVERANMMLGVELKAKLGDEVDLGFKEIDMMFLVVHQLLKEAARHIVLHTVAVGCCFFVKRPCFRFGL